MSIILNNLRYTIDWFFDVWYTVFIKPMPTQKPYSHDSAGNFDAKLKSKYKASLFDLAYLLSIVLTNIFLHKKSIYKNDLIGLIKTLERTRKKFIRFKDRFPVLIENIDESLKWIKEDLYNSSNLDIKTKLVLMWTYFLEKQIVVQTKIPMNLNGDEREIIGVGLSKRYEWIYYPIILKWFYKKLLDCSYSSLIKPDPDNQKEIKHAKSELEKNYFRYRSDLENDIWLYIKRQGYFGDPRKEIRIKIRRTLKAYPPIILIKFSRDLIEIGELHKEGIMINKFVFDNSKNILVKKPYLNKEATIKKPTVIFPNGEEFISKDYTPPLSLSKKRIDKLFSDFVNETLAKKLTI